MEQFGYGEKQQITRFGTINRESIPVPKYIQIGGDENKDNIIGIAAGPEYVLALKADGTVWGWGLNSSNQLVQGNTDIQMKPVQLKGIGGTGVLENVKQITAGNNFAAALLEDGRVVAWGTNNRGQLGDNTTAAKNYPVYVVDPTNTALHLNNIVKIAAGYEFMIGLANDGTVWAWGLNTVGQLGDNTTANKSLPVKVLETTVKNLENIVDIAAGEQTGYAVSNDGTVWGWGYNGYGQLGIGNITNQLLAVKVKKEVVTGETTTYEDLTNIKKVETKQYHTTLITYDGKAYSVGRNDYGQLGIGETSAVNKLYAVPVKDSTGTSVLSNVTDSSLGQYFTMYILNNEYVYATGINTLSQLGTMHYENYNLPVMTGRQIEITNKVQTIKQGEQKQLGYRLTENLNLLNNGDTNKNIVWSSSNSAVATVDNTGKVTGVSNGATAIKVTDTISNTSNIITIQVRNIPNIDDKVKIAQGLNHTLALKHDGTVLAWGDNIYGQLGNNTKTASRKPNGTSSRWRRKSNYKYY